MWINTIGLNLFCIWFWSRVVLAEGVKDKPAVDWWCDETECFYSDTIPKDDHCDGNKTIPYRFNSTTGTCELNLLGLLLSFRVLNNRLGAVVKEKNRKRSEIIFQGIINSAKVFVFFTIFCVLVGCFYCYWVQYSDNKLKKSLKAVVKQVQAQQINKTKKHEVKKENKDRCKTVTEDVQVSIV